MLPITHQCFLTYLSKMRQNMEILPQPKTASITPTCKEVITQKARVLPAQDDIIKSGQNDLPLQTKIMDFSYNDKKELTPIQHFYSGATIFITGGTGFLGKILIEKLLRSCPNIQTIFLLVRIKKGKGIHTRIDELFEDVIFDRLKAECPKYRNKIEAVSGDCSVAGLGLSIADRKRLMDSVDIVFHVAATVRFDEKLRLALAINVNATRDILDLCKHMKHLKSVIHVSTAYSNCHLKRIEEKFYDNPVQSEDIEKLIGKLDDRAIEELTSKILGKWPNTYTFTKALAEACVKEQSKGLPLAVFRPGIVTSTVREPIIGWIDNFYGPTGVAAGVLSGLQRTQYCVSNTKANMVPVDMVVNAMIAAAWDIAENKNLRDNDEIPIYNYVSTVRKPLTWKEYSVVSQMYAEEFPINQALWKSSLTFNSNRYVDMVYQFFYQVVPALIFDSIAIMLGKKPRLYKMSKKVFKFSGIIGYFATRNWDFVDDNVSLLWKRLNPKDKDNYHFNITDLDWLSYLKNYMIGIRLYLIKDPSTTLERARMKAQRFYYMDKALATIIKFFSLYMLWSLLSKVFNLFLHY